MRPTKTLHPRENQLHKQIHSLANDEDGQAQQALQALRQRQEQEWASVPAESIEALIKAVKGRFARTKQTFAQKEIVALLGNLGPRARSALPQLLELLHEGVPDAVCEAALTSLGKMGKEAKGAVEPILGVLARARPALAAHAIRALGNIGQADERIRAVLFELWLSPSELQACKAQVAIALCKLRLADRPVIASLAKALLANQDASLRKTVAEALGWCGKGDLDVVPALLAAALSDANEEVRQVAQAGLDQMGLSHAKAMQLCSRQLGDSPHAETALRKSGPAAVGALIEAFATREPEVRVQAARTLACFGEAALEAVPALTKGLHHKEPEVRLAAAKALWNITKTADVVAPALADLLKVKANGGPDAAESRRRYLQTIMEALSRIGPPAQAAVSALTALTKDANRHVRESALTALQRIAPGHHG